MTTMLEYVEMMAGLSPDPEFPSNFSVPVAAVASAAVIDDDGWRKRSTPQVIASKASITVSETGSSSSSRGTPAKKRKSADP